MNQKRAVLLLPLALLVLTLVVSFAHATPPSDTLTPNQDVNTGWDMTPSSGTRYEKVQTNDGDTTYIYKATFGSEQIFGLPDISAGGYTITGVTVYAVARKQAFNDVSFNIKMWTHGSGYSSGNIGLSDPEVYQLYSYTWLTNPFTGASWTVTEINDLQAGLRISNSAGTSYQVAVTQFYVVVNEVPEEVIPEYGLGALLAVVACFAAFIISKRPHLKLK